MNPDQILAALTEVYAQCPSYRDAGRVTTRFLYVEGPHNTSVRPFETAFVRPDRFRFEYRDRFRANRLWQRSIVWAGGGEVRTWWDGRPGVEKPESLSLALAGATGVSGGSAHTVPALLMPDQISGRRLTNLRNPVSLEDAEIAGVTCYRIRGEYGPHPMDPARAERFREEYLRLTGQRLVFPQNSTMTLWIDRGTLLVRRIEKRRGFQTDAHTGLRPHSTEQVTEYAPEVGVTITEAELRFDPSEKESL